MSFRIVKDSPTGFRPHEAMRSDGMDCRFEIGHLEEKHGLIAGGIGLRTFGFQTDERSVSSELGMVPGLLVREVEAQCVEVKLLALLPQTVRKDRS